MKELPLKYEGRGVFDQKGYTFELVYKVKRDYGWMAVYHKEGHGGEWYEVMKVRTRKRDKSILGRPVHKKGDLHLPTSNDWGSYGLTCTSLLEAMDAIERKEW